MPRVAAVLLAAGASSRMGTAKQLLRIGGESLVRRAVQTALASRCDRVLVVVGAHADRVRTELAGLPLRIVEAADWQEGLSASIRCGVAAARSDPPSADAVVLMVTDQPRMTTSHLDALVDALAEEAAERVASGYAGTVGVPALFGRRHFDALCSLRGDRGAKDLLQEDMGTLVTVPFPDAAFDVDTPEDAEEERSP